MQVEASALSVATCEHKEFTKKATENGFSCNLGNSTSEIVKRFGCSINTK